MDPAAVAATQYSHIKSLHSHLQDLQGCAYVIGQDQWDCGIKQQFYLSHKLTISGSFISTQNAGKHT